MNNFSQVPPPAIVGANRLREDRFAARWALLLVVPMLGWFWQRGESFIAANGPTFDEGVHLTAGYSYWVAGDFRLNAEDPPLMKLLWAFPWVLGHAPQYPVELAAEANHWQVARVWMYDSGATAQSLLTPARRVNLAVGTALVLLVGWWAYRLWGTPLAGLAACGFAVCDPNGLALSCLLSTDVGLAFFGLLSCYLLWEYVGTPTHSLLIATGISLGLLLATKFSALGIVVGLGLAALLHLLRGKPLALPGKQDPCGLRPALELAIRLGTIAIVTVAATYGFIHFDEWGKGLKFQLTRAGHGDGVMYLHGELSRRGWLHYFLAALLVKLPLGVIVGAGLSAAVGLCCLGKAKTPFSQDLQKFSPVDSTPPPSSTNRALWIIVPPVVFFALASYSRVDLGIRVVLPVLPFLYLLAAGLATVRSYRPLAQVVLLGCLLDCTRVAQLSNPSELAYFNELRATFPGGEPPLADSNCDWGQGLPALKRWMDTRGIDCVYLAYFGTDRPESHGIRYRQLPSYGHLGIAQPKTMPAELHPKLVAVSLNHLVGLFLNDPELYAWLRHREPVTTLAGSIHVFDLTSDPEGLARVRALSTP